MRHAAIVIVALVLLVGCAHSRDAEEHATASGNATREVVTSEVEHQRTEEGPSERIRMDGEWFIAYLNQGLPDDAEEPPRGDPPGSVTVCHGCAVPIAPAPEPRAPRPRGLVFAGSVEVERHGPVSTDRDRTATSTTRERAAAEVRAEAKEESKTAVGPTGLPSLIGWVVLGLAVAAGVWRVVLAVRKARGALP